MIPVVTQLPKTILTFLFFISIGNLMAQDKDIGYFSISGSVFLILKAV